MIHSLNREQAGAELYQAQFKLGLAKQALPNKNLSYVIIKKIVWLRLANMLQRPAISLKLLDISLQQKSLDQAVYIVQLFALNCTTTRRSLASGFSTNHRRAFSVKTERHNKEKYVRFWGGVCQDSGLGIDAYRYTWISIAAITNFEPNSNV